VSTEPPLVSIVLPVFNERENVGPLVAEIDAVFVDESYEIVAVDDGSSDGSLEELDRLGTATSRLRVVCLETHAGQSAALAAGFDAARGEWILTMDADGQNAPGDGLKLLDVVRGPGPATAAVGYRVRRVDTRWKRVQSRIANRARDLITGDRVRDTGCSLKVMPRDGLRRVPRFQGMHRFLATLLRWAGEHVVEVEVGHRPRWHGRTKYGMWHRLRVGLQDAFGVRWLLKRRVIYRVAEIRRTE
jgi:glycosyltransferase involved in cell wall biosynthesis